MGNIGYYYIPLNQNELFTISSRDPMFFVYFVQTSGVHVSIYIDDSFYKSFYNDFDIVGFDSGTHRATVVFKAVIQTELAFSVLVFPTECKIRRFISSLPYYRFELSKTSSLADWRIYNHQVACFWPANPTSHHMMITTHTGSPQDVLKLYTNIGLATTFFGHSHSVIHSSDGAEFFIWNTDIINLTDNVTVQVIANSPIQFPAFSISLSELDSQHVSLAFVQGNDLGNSSTVLPENKGTQEFSILIPVGFGVTVVLVVVAFVSGFWAIRVWRAYNVDFGVEPTNVRFSERTYIRDVDEFSTTEEG